MQRTLFWITILSFAAPSPMTLYAQCGSPPYACSGHMECDCDGTWYCDGSECSYPPPYEGTCNEGSAYQCTANGWQCVPQGSPIIIDTKGEGYHLTSLQGGVQFTFFPAKAPVQMSWTDSAYSNGFLVLDRNGDGVINDGSELFGTETPQPPTTTPNGFNALAVYDLAVNGGNGNGVIDAGDAVWPRLRVWIDSNHDGISQSNELHALSELGISQLDLRYRLSRYTDQFGNQFRYEADLQDSLGRKPDRFYDVMLVWSPLGSLATATSTRGKGSRLTLFDPLQLADRRAGCRRGGPFGTPPA